MDLVEEIVKLQATVDALKRELETVKLTMVQMQMAQNPTMAKAQKGLLRGVLKLEKGSTAIPSQTTLSRKFLNLIM